MSQPNVTYPIASLAVDPAIVVLGPRATSEPQLPLGKIIEQSLEHTGGLISEFEQSTAVSLSIIIPAFNELKTLRQIVSKVVALAIDKQIVIVDDGSTDGTRELILQLVNEYRIEYEFHTSNRGKGAAIQTGMRKAFGNIVIVQDADLEYEPSDILNVIDPIVRGEAKVVYGSRYLANATQDGSVIHRLGNWVLTQLSNVFSGQKLTDMETCYKAFHKSVLDQLTIEQPRFGFEPEITAKVSRLGIRIREVPVGYSPRSWHEGKKIGWRDLCNTVWCIIRYRFY